MPPEDLRDGLQPFGARRVERARTHREAQLRFGQRHQVAALGRTRAETRKVILQPVRGGCCVHGGRVTFGRGRCVGLGEHPGRTFALLRNDERERRLLLRHCDQLLLETPDLRFGIGQTRLQHTRIGLSLCLDGHRDRRV